MPVPTNTGAATTQMGQAAPKKASDAAAKAPRPSPPTIMSPESFGEKSGSGSETRTAPMARASVRPRSHASERTTGDSA